jgi:hypothetical protein
MGVEIGAHLVDHGTDRLGRETADIGRQQEALEVPEAFRHGRLALDDGEPGAGDARAAQRLDQSIGIDQTASGRADQVALGPEQV